jgi:hypothetical protein
LPECPGLHFVASLPETPGSNLVLPFTAFSIVFPPRGNQALAID